MTTTRRRRPARRTPGPDGRRAAPGAGRVGLGPLGHPQRLGGLAHSQGALDLPSGAGDPGLTRDGSVGPVRPAAVLWLNLEETGLLEVDPVCVFPGCRRRSRRCDLDHLDPYRPPDDGGPPGQTRPDNLAPLCRRHHRAKTHGRWRYRRLPDGSYRWTSPTGRTFDVPPARRLGPPHQR